MARKPVLTIDTLKELGLEKLAQLVLSEAEQNTNFARLVSAAFAGQLGLGSKFQLADNMTVDLGYRAKGVFNATITATNGPNATAVHYIDQTVQLGLTVGF